jgi:hypothetical protein
MRQMTTVNKSVLLAFFLLIFPSPALMAVSPEVSLFERELGKVRYNVAYAASLSGGVGPAFDETDESGSNSMEDKGKKSPAKAFLLSLAVPGLGQYYYGSKIKPIAFIGVEATAWIMHIKWRNEGEDLTSEFEQFNRDHWIQNNYEDYLEIVYGYRDDDSISAMEVSHNLPDTRTQQYYEMTGKYDQFAWGWDDAELNGLTHADFDTSATSTFPQAITGPSTRPYSARRLTYETMRDDANKKYDKADKMIMVALANRVVSALEAFISAKSINNKVKKAGEFSNWKIKPSLKSYNSKRDTPYIKVTYKF